MTMAFVQTDLGADPIVIEGYFAATPKAVFQAWTDPAVVLKWFGPEPGSLLSADINLWVGGSWRFVMQDDGEETMGFEGEYLAIDPGRRLVLSWSKFRGKSSGLSEITPKSHVEITLSPKGSGTDIRIVHSSIDDNATRKGFTYGWEHGIMNLRELLEA